MTRRMPPRAAAAHRASAENVRAAAELLRAGDALTPQGRDALVDLLEHLAAGAGELVPTTVWDRVARLALQLREPHRGRLPELSPPNVGGGVARS